MAVMLPEQELEEMHEMVKENNRMLKDMRRDSFIKSVLGIIWWAIILVVLPYLTWLYLEPYLKTITDAYSQVQGQSQQASEALQKLQELGGGFDLNKILEQFKGATGQ